MAKIGKRLESHAAEKMVLQIERVNMKPSPAIVKLVNKGGYNTVDSDKITSFIVNFRSLAFGAVYLSRRANGTHAEHRGARSMIISLGRSMYRARM